MDKRGKMNRTRSVLALSVGVIALALLAPVAANAQVTVSHVRVTVRGKGSTALYCDTATTCTGGVQVWNLGGGVNLATGETLVLTQTGLLIVGGVGIGGNFDTSDRVKPTAPIILPCGTVAPATM